jgi:DNA-binding beta-propeller fold protein YncE
MPRQKGLLPAGVVVSERTPDQPGESGISDQFRTGSEVAGYRLAERIGKGGMAVVFRAYDRRLDRMVALKILAPALAADEAFRQRFIRESRAAAAVEDPHIIPVFEAGEAAGVLFIAMRYVRGGDVRSLIDRTGPLPAGRAAEIISQAASALDAAHAKGLVHRDVKPANMLLEASPAAGRPEHVYLSDFGLSKAALSTSGLTATGQFLGTLDYVAPEQIESRPLDGRTDEYGLACSAFEMLSGEPPFRRPDGGLSVMYAHLSEPPPPVRLRRPELPAEVDAVMTKALAKAPGDRYASCREFAAALRNAVGAGATSPAGPARAHPATQIARPAEAPGTAARTAAAAGTAGLAAAAAPAPAGRPSEPEPPLASGRTGGQLPPPGAVTERGQLVPPDLPGGSRAGVTEPGQPDPTGTRLRARPRWRSPAVAGACAVVLIAAGAFALISHGTGKHPGAGSPAAPRGPKAGQHVTALPSVPMPGCGTQTATAANLTKITSAAAGIGGSPFGVAVTPDSRYILVSGANSVTVLRNTAGGALPTVVRTISVPGAGKGDTLTADGQFLLAATNTGATIVNVARAVRGDPDPVLGALTSPKGSGATEVLITADQHYAFVSLDGTEVAVFDLHRALTEGVSTADFVGYIPAPANPAGLATDGTWLYIASLKGYLTVARLSQAETDPAHAVAATMRAGCQPARAMLSADGQVLWVTDRGADYLLGFSTTRMRSDPAHSLVARVMVGEAPIGETFVEDGSRIVVADSNLNKVPGAPANLAVVDVAKALSGQDALLGYLPTGRLPHQFAVEPDGRTLLVTLQTERQLETVRIADLP